MFFKFYFIALFSFIFVNLSEGQRITSTKFVLYSDHRLFSNRSKYRTALNAEAKNTIKLKKGL